MDGQQATGRNRGAPERPTPESQAMTSIEPSPHPWRVRDVLAVFARCLLGTAFLYMGLNKALHPVEFLKLVRQYEVLQHPLLLNGVAATLPWFEMFCGVLIVLGVA